MWESAQQKYYKSTTKIKPLHASSTLKQSKSIIKVLKKSKQGYASTTPKHKTIKVLQQLNKQVLPVIYYQALSVENKVSIERVPMQMVFPLQDGLWV